MGILETTGFLLALAMLAGLNLYLTAFLTGLAVRLDWFHWAQQTEALQAFGHPVVLAVVLVLFLVEFGIDKVPWADSLWDSIHTFLRPAGGVLLAVAALGAEAGAFVQAMVALGAGAAALLTHLARAGLRLGINTSPEPFSNIGTSVAEDLAVVGGFILAVQNPLAALIAFGALLAAVVYFTPTVMRLTRAMLWLIWRKLRIPANHPQGLEPPLPNKLPAEERILVGQALAGAEGPIAWAVPCVTGKTRGLPGLTRNQFGYVVAHDHPDAPLCFVTKRNFSRSVHAIGLDGCEATSESHLLFESLVVFGRNRKPYVVFRFHRGQDGLAERLAMILRRRLGLPEDGEQGESTRDAAQPPTEEGSAEESVEAPAFPEATGSREADSGNDEAVGDRGSGALPAPERPRVPLPPIPET